MGEIINAPPVEKKITRVRLAQKDIFINAQKSGRLLLFSLFATSPLLDLMA